MRADGRKRMARQLRTMLDDRERARRARNIEAMHRVYRAAVAARLRAA